ncbi:MAG: DMT family transporter [Rhodanobacteraceae bacterium]|nr:DMT family transporter [Rhodanobacteraceae bacterium]
MARNVARPARHSVRTSLPLSRSWNQRSSTGISVCRGVRASISRECLAVNGASCFRRRSTGFGRRHSGLCDTKALQAAAESRLAATLRQNWHARRFALGRRCPLPVSASTTALLQIHFCVLLWGLTAILGKLISLPATALVWWRMLLVSGTALLLPQVWRGLRRMPRRQLAIYAGIGLVVALHWLTFYGAIKLANASVAVISMGLCPIFLALIEPWIARRPFDPRELGLGLAVVPGVLLVVGGTPSDMQIGLLVGVVSAFLASAFSALNKRYAANADALTVTAIELGAGTLLLTLLAPFLAGDSAAFVLPDGRDTLLLALLAYGCTLLPFALSLIALRQISAFTAQLAINLEPVYAITIAALLFGEQRELNASFYLGVVIIVAAVIVHPLLARRS